MGDGAMRTRTVMRRDVGAVTAADAPMHPADPVRGRTAGAGSVVRALRRPRLRGRRHLEGDRPGRGDRRERRSGLHAEPAHVAADRAHARGDRPVPRHAGARRASGRSRATRSTSSTSRAATPSREQVAHGAPRDDGDGRRDRRRGGRLPRRLAPRLGFDEAVALVEPALRELLELTTDDLWLLMENAAGAGGTIGRSIAELAALFDAVDRHPRLGLCLDSCHWWASGVDVSDPDALDAALEDLDARIGTRPRPRPPRERLAEPRSDRIATATTSSAEGSSATASQRFWATPRSPACRRSPRRGRTQGRGDRGPRPHAHAPPTRAAALGATRSSRRPSRTRGSVARSRGSSWNSGIRQPRSSSRCWYVPTTSTSHIGSGRAVRPTAPKPVASRLRLLEQRQVDLDVVDLLHAADVRMPPRLVRVDERTRHAETRAGVDDLLAVDVAMATRDLVLWPQGELCSRSSA